MQLQERVVLGEVRGEKVWEIVTRMERGNAFITTPMYEELWVNRHRLLKKGGDNLGTRFPNVSKRAMESEATKARK